MLLRHCQAALQSPWTTLYFLPAVNTQRLAFLCIFSHTELLSIFLVIAFIVGVAWESVWFRFVCSSWLMMRLLYFVPFLANIVSYVVLLILGHLHHQGSYHFSIIWSSALYTSFRMWDLMASRVTYLWSLTFFLIEWCFVSCMAMFLWVSTDHSNNTSINGLTQTLSSTLLHSPAAGIHSQFLLDGSVGRRSFLAQLKPGAL